MTEIALAQHYNLQETLVDTIADKLINLPGIQLLRLTSAKTEAYDNVKAVGIEVWRRKDSETFPIMTNNEPLRRIPITPLSQRDTQASSNEIFANSKDGETRAQQPK